MTKRERVAAALSGAEVDRVPRCFWHHFGGNEIGWRGMAAAHEAFYRRYDFDFIKMMNDTPYVDSHAGLIEKASDFRKLGKVDLASTSMAPMIGGIRDLRSRVDEDVMMICTIFGAFSTVDKLCGRQGGKVIPQDPEAIREGLKHIGENLAAFAKAAIEAGADGIFLASQSSKGALPDGMYADLLKPAEVRILDGAAEGGFNMVHVCGEENDFSMYLDYPAHALNWADKTAGPSLAEARRMTDKCLAGGIDHTTVNEKTPDALRDEVRQALAEGGKKKYILAAGCSVPNEIAEERLAALAEASGG